MEHQGELLVGVVPKLACDMLLGRDWTPLYNILERVRDVELARKKMGASEGWLGKEEADPTNMEGSINIDLNRIASSRQFREAQSDDPELETHWRRAQEDQGEAASPRGEQAQYEVRNHLLYHVPGPRREGPAEAQLVVLRQFHQVVWQLAHASPVGGHLGQDKTLAKVGRWFFWLGMGEEVARRCAACLECQKTRTERPARAPLQPMPVMDTPFARIALDIVGPLPRSSSGHQYVLVMVDYATRYPEAVPLQTATAPQVAEELIKWVARIGVPEEILTKQGRNFMSGVMKVVCQTLQIRQIRTAVYHPQTNGLVERLNGTLKRVLRRCIQGDPRKWNLLLPLVLFSLRDTPQDSMKFSPFELVLGHRPRGWLQVLREEWERDPGGLQDLAGYRQAFQQRIRTAQNIARENLRDAQARQKERYDNNTRERVFEPGQRVLVLLPTSTSRFLTQWQGPFEILRRVGPVDYEVHQPGHHQEKQIFHVNLLREWKEPTGWVTFVEAEGEDLGPQGQQREGTLSNEVQQLIGVGEDLSELQKQETRKVIQEFRDVFRIEPGWVHGAMHTIKTPSGAIVREKWRPIPHHLLDAMREEVNSMLQLGVVRPSRSPWRSPLVPIRKPDGSLRLCVDYRRLNALATFDAFPMPQVDKLIERIGEAQYISTLDLAKGYWQIPVALADRPKTAFGMPWGLYEFVRMPFGLHGAAATFQRLTDRLLAPHAEYAAAYIDDIIIYSPTWTHQKQALRAVLSELRQARLTANPRKCALAKRETKYLGFLVGRGTIRLLADKVKTVRNFPAPQNCRQLRSFLGLTNYYRRFVPHFSELMAPLTEALKGRKNGAVRWTEHMEQCFRKLKQAL
ncbi:uncharacterized protein LOC132243291 [Alligator mississippiensis]|uniref:uncharacterized protein LOC132243291 n=1 Tax=Alligator mississippiensis TaxID=8496 RepID=UPI0009074976|nr:uncharacterized protein LOC132243291 [Alligator mississippiensis]